MTTDISDREPSELQRLEENLWREGTRFGRDYMEKVIATDFFEFGRSVRAYQREDTLPNERTSIDAALLLQDLKIRLLANEVAQVTYTLK